MRKRLIYLFVLFGVFLTPVNVYGQRKKPASDNAAMKQQPTLSIQSHYYFNTTFTTTGW